MPGEGANAFRVYLGNQNGQVYELQTIDIKAVSRGIYALRLRLYETANYREQPPANGDALIYLTWRGLASNVLKIGLGSTSGDLKIPESPKLAKSQNETESANIVGYLYSGDRTRFMEQATFGPTTALDLRIRRIGLRTWLSEQFEAPYPSANNPYPNIPLMPTAIPSNYRGWFSFMLSNALYANPVTAMVFQRSFLRRRTASPSRCVGIKRNFGNERRANPAIEPYDCVS